jgi:hypothetical protein
MPVRALHDLATNVSEQHVQPPQPDRVDGEVVGCEHRLGVLAEEGAPTAPEPLRRGRDVGAGEHVPHQGRRNRDAELAQLVGDPDVAPVAVLAREPQDQLAQVPGRFPVGAAAGAGRSIDAQRFAGANAAASPA